MIKFDEDKNNKKFVHKDCGGQIIKVGDQALHSMSSTRIALVTVMKLCALTVKVQHTANTIPNGHNLTDKDTREDWDWHAQVWSTALYVLKRDEENNI